MWIQMPMKPCVHLHPWQRPSTTPFAVWLLVWGCARFIIEYFCIALCPNSMCTCNNEKMNLLNSSFFCRGIRSTQNCGFPAMPSARSLTSTRLSKLQACALLCLGVPPLVLLACIYVWNRLRIKAMILHGKYSHLICLLWRPEFSSFGLGWFSMGSIHIWFVYCGDLSLHLSDLVAETIDRDATRDWAFGAYVFETNLQRFFAFTAVDLPTNKTCSTVIELKFTNWSISSFHRCCPQDLFCMEYFSGCESIVRGFRFLAPMHDTYHAKQQIGHILII